MFRTLLTVALAAQRVEGMLPIGTKLKVDLAQEPQLGAVNVSTGLQVALVRDQGTSTLPVGTRLKVDLAQASQLGAVNVSTGLRVDLAQAPQLGAVNVSTKLTVDLVRDQAPSTLPIGTKLTVGLTQAPQLGVVSVSTGLRVDLVRDQGTSTLPVGTKLAVALVQAPQLGAVNVSTGLTVALAHEQQPGETNIPTKMTVALRSAPQPGSLNFPTSLTVALAEAPQPGAVSIPTSLTVALAQAPQPGAVSVSTGLRVDLVRDQGTSTLPVGTRLTVGLAHEQQPGAVSVSTGLRVDLVRAQGTSTLPVGTKLAVALVQAPQLGAVNVPTRMTVALAQASQLGAVNVSTGLRVDLVRDQGTSTLPIGTKLKVDLAQASQLGAVNVSTGLQVALVRAQGTSTLPVGTRLKVDLAGENPPSTMEIGTGPLTVDLIQAPQLGAVNVSTGLQVALVRAQGTSAVNVPTKMTVAVQAAEQPTRVAIGTGPLTVLAKPFVAVRFGTGVTVALLAAQPTSRIPVGTGLNISLTQAGQAAFAFTRDLVIAGQADLTTINPAVTEFVVLGIEFTDPVDFKSVANGGKIQQTGAEDVQFALISDGTVLFHNIVSHNPDTGRLVFDLKLPSWNVTSDVPVRMSYGFVGQVTGSVKIGTSVNVELEQPWWFLPIRSERDSPSGTSFWYDRGGTNVPALDALAAEEADVALIDAMAASSKGTSKANVSTWARLIGDQATPAVPLATGPRNDIDTQFDWRTSTVFGFGHCVEWLPKLGAASDGSGWLFWVMQTVPADRSTDTGVVADRSAIWNEIIAGDHDDKYIKFGERIREKIDLSGHPRKKFVLDANHEMNQTNDHRVFDATRQLYIDAMDQTIRMIRQGAGFHVRFCHRPGFSPEPDASGNPTTKIGTYASFIPTEVDVLALSLHPGDDVINQTTVDQLIAGTLNANYYGIPELLAAADNLGLPIAFPEYSPRFDNIGLRLCPVANLFMTSFFNDVIVPNRDRLVCDCIWNQNMRDLGAYQGTGSGDTQWDAMVANRKDLWSGTKSVTAPANQTLPHITPTTATVGATLTCSQGVWTGTLPITYARRWRRGTTDIAGALGSGQTYLTVAADVGQAISCRVTATNVPFPAPVAVISDNSVTVAAATSSFVLRTPLKIETATDIVRPTAFTPLGINAYTAPAGRVIDLRGRRGFNHDTS